MSDQEKTALIADINHALDSIRPHLKVDGGDIEVVDVNDDFEVSIKWLGNCEFCSMSVMTMRAGVEQAILQQLPQIKAVTAINGVQAL
jgi:Fe-S cluster biogenesis protein NfuA